MLGLVSLIAVLTSPIVLCNAGCVKDENMMNSIVEHIEGKISYQAPDGVYTEEAPIFAIFTLLPKNDDFLAEDIPNRQLLSINASDKYTIMSFWIKDNHIRSAEYMSPKDAAVGDWKKWLEDDTLVNFSNLRITDLEKVTDEGCEKYWRESSGGVVKMRMGLDAKCITQMSGIKDSETKISCTIEGRRCACNLELAFGTGLFREEIEGGASEETSSEESSEED